MITTTDIFITTITIYCCYYYTVACVYILPTHVTYSIVSWLVKTKITLKPLQNKKKKPNHTKTSTKQNKKETKITVQPLQNKRNPKSR